MGRLDLKVVPRLPQEEIVGGLCDGINVKVQTPPDKSRAYEAVIALLADRLRIDSLSIAVASGHG